MRWFLLDRLTEVIPGKKAVGIKCFTRSEHFFTDHFHGFPIVPAVLQTEMMATTAGKAIKIFDDTLLPVVGSIQKAKFYEHVRPGDQCIVTAEIEKLGKSYATANCEVRVDGKRVSIATIMFAILPATKLDPNWRDPVVAEWYAANGIADPRTVKTEGEKA